LQFVMARLWESRDRQGLITWDVFKLLLLDPRRRRLNAGWALAQAAEAAYRKANPTTARAMRGILLRLVAPAPGSELVLRRISLQCLVQPGDDENAVRAAVQLLEESHLLRRTDGDGSDDPHIELVHTALARLWERLDDWIGEVRVAEAKRVRLDDAVQLWLQDQRSDAWLWNEVQLQDIRELDNLTLAETEFVRCSEERVAADKRV